MSETACIVVVKSNADSTAQPTSITNPQHTQHQPLIKTLGLSATTYGARVSLSHMFCFLSFERCFLRMNLTRLVALMTLVRMATPRMARHTAAAYSKGGREGEGWVRGGVGCRRVSQSWESSKNTGSTPTPQPTTSLATLPLLLPTFSMNCSRRSSSSQPRKAQFS